MPSPLPLTASVDRSAAPNSRPMSDGLIGVASMRSTTSSAAGSGVAMRASESSSVPSSVMRVRICKPFAGTSSSMSFACRGRGRES